jgi:Cu(I)-responsive transcriptional regulator
MTESVSMFTIGKIAKQSGLGIETIRYYERIGLLMEPQRSESGYRHYNADAVQQLRFIRKVKNLGFSLKEAGHFLKLSECDADQAEVKQLIVEKRAMIDEKINDLLRMNEALGMLEESCPGEANATNCPILAALNDEHSL